jgi:capsular exopolysaccharide synthesis family protein
MTDEAAGTYLRAIARHGRLVAGMTALSLAVALVSVAQRPHNYEASASILVNPLPASDPTFTGMGVVLDTGDPARTVQTAAALINSPQAAKQAAASLGVGWDAQRVENRVSITPRGQSNVLAVTATASSAADAAGLANAFASAAVAHRAAVVQHNIAVELAALQQQLSRRSHAHAPPSEVQDLTTRVGELRALLGSGRDPTLAVSELAQLPGSPTGAAGWLIVLIAGIAGLAVGSLGAQALELFSRKIRDERDVESLIPGPILASIPRAPKTPGRNGLSPMVLSAIAFEQVRLLREQIRKQVDTSVIMVTSADAGDGKTTVAAALAAAFAEGDQKVILMDLDLRNPGIAGLLGVEGPFGPRAPDEPQPTLAKMLVTPPGFSQLKVLPARAGDMSGFESLIRRLPKLIAEARKLADWVIVDTAPLGAVSDAVRIAGECDGVLVVVRPGHTDRAKLALSRDLLDRVGAVLLGTVLVGYSAESYAAGYYGYGYLAGEGESRTASWRG